MRRGAKRAATRVPAAVVLVLLIGAPQARADEQITSGPPNLFLTSEVTIDQGERITLFNTDLAAHDVLARGLGTDGKPLFRSELAAIGETVPVEGVEYLTTGDYAFLCSLHPQMEGVITVTSAGTPEPRPDAGAGAVKLRVLDKRLATVRQNRALRIRVTTDTAATVRMAARANGTLLAKGTKQVSGPGSSTAKLSLTPAGRRLVKGGKPIDVKVTASAKDRQGNVKTTSARTTLR